MKKFSLNLDDLGVQSFETTSSMATERGTVQGHADTEADSCAVTQCGDWQCETNHCPSVNVLNCPSALYTDCNCGSWGGGGRATDVDEYGYISPNCS